MTILDLPFIARRRLPTVSLKPPPLTLMLWPLAAMLTYFSTHQPLDFTLMFWPFLLVVVSIFMIFHHCSNHMEAVRKRQKYRERAGDMGLRVSPPPPISIMKTAVRAGIWAVTICVVVFFAAFPNVV